MKLLIEKNTESKEIFLNNIEQAEPVYKEIIRHIEKMGISLTHKEFKELLFAAYVSHQMDSIPLEYTEKISEFLKEKFKSQTDSVKDLPIDISIIKIKGLPAFIKYLYEVNSSQVSLRLTVDFFLLDKGLIKQNKDVINSRLEKFNIYAETKEEEELAGMMQEICSLVNGYIERKDKVASSDTNIDILGFRFELGRLEADSNFIKTYAGKI